jgi:hypothetical protein
LCVDFRQHNADGIRDDAAHHEDDDELSTTSPHHNRYDEEPRRGRQASLQQHVLLRLVALFDSIIGKKDGIIGKKDIRQEERCWIISSGFVGFVDIVTPVVDGDRLRWSSSRKCFS